MRKEQGEETATTEPWNEWTTDPITGEILEVFHTGQHAENDSQAKPRFAWTPRFWKRPLFWLIAPIAAFGLTQSIPNISLEELSEALSRITSR